MKDVITEKIEKQSKVFSFDSSDELGSVSFGFCCSESDNEDNELFDNKIEEKVSEGQKSNFGVKRKQKLLESDQNSDKSSIEISPPSKVLGDDFENPKMETNILNDSSEITERIEPETVVRHQRRQCHPLDTTPTLWPLPFHLFRRELSDKLPSTKEQKGINTLTTTAGEKWRKLSEDEKGVYYIRARERVEKNGGRCLDKSSKLKEEAMSSASPRASSRSSMRSRFKRKEQPELSFVKKLTRPSRTKTAATHQSRELVHNYGTRKNSTARLGEGKKTALPLLESGRSSNTTKAEEKEEEDDDDDDFDLSFLTDSSDESNEADEDSHFVEVLGSKPKCVSSPSQLPLQAAVPLFSQPSPSVIIEDTDTLQNILRPSDDAIMYQLQLILQNCKDGCNVSLLELRKKLEHTFSFSFKSYSSLIKQLIIKVTDSMELTESAYGQFCVT
ncbi:uncharacterized protein MONOS_10072 [Monocercomonoides exilis]|uniref:uncharacterized protein n=1 Tax=Monocercomonoides exilis TaxID=2049356 RepID=UPI00355A4A81|nr:hypothetical protein MONOS_10072 [Monocercomonoides exilis]